MDKPLSDLRTALAELRTMRTASNQARFNLVLGQVQSAVAKISEHASKQRALLVAVVAMFDAANGNRGVVPNAALREVWDAAGPLLAQFGLDSIEQVRALQAQAQLARAMAPSPTPTEETT